MTDFSDFLQPDYSGANSTLKETARRLELNFAPGGLEYGYGPSCNGNYRELSVRINSGDIGIINRNMIRTQVVVSCTNPWNQEFSITKAGIFYGINRMLNSRDFSTGDPKFDNRIKVTAKDHDFLKNFLSEENKTLIYKAFISHYGTGTLSLRHDHLRYQEDTMANSPDRYVTLVQLMSNFAIQMDEMRFFELGAESQEHPSGEDDVF